MVFFLFIFLLILLTLPVGRYPKVLLHISSAALHKSVPFLACFPPSLGITPFRHHIIPIRVRHTSSSPFCLILSLWIW